jgi:hypothetical protein
MARPVPDHVRSSIRATKAALRASCDVEARFDEIERHMRAEVEQIRAESDAGRPVIPEISFADIEAGAVDTATTEAIRRRGCAVIRGVFPRSTAEAWNEELGEYLSGNGYVDRANAGAEDDFFDTVSFGNPQIFDIYWSRPQVLARQAESMATTKRFLNGLWDVDAPAGPEFDPEHDYIYADRIRRRDPGDATLGLAPHIDTGSFERWVDPAFRAIYADIFSDDWTRFDPWRAAHRTQTREFESATVCSAFRTFQGWTALTTQGPRTGTLRLLPIANSIAHVLLRSLQPDVPDDELLLAAPGQVLGADGESHPTLMDGMVSIPEVSPGDTVWWHPDIIHGVEDAHEGTEQANVMYIAATPRCPKNLMYARQQAAHFLDGRSSPDFAAQDFEVDFRGRATVDDLTELGRAQMAL